MSVQSTPSPARFPASTSQLAETAGPAAKDTAGAGARPEEDAAAGAHHRRAVPDEHLCACGRFRHHCVREAVRAVWTASGVSRARRARP